jgi:hypothetical protein
MHTARKKRPTNRGDQSTPKNKRKKIQTSGRKVVQLRAWSKHAITTQQYPNVTSQMEITRKHRNGHKSTETSTKKKHSKRNEK